MSHLDNVMRRERILKFLYSGIQSLSNVVTVGLGH